MVPGFPGSDYIDSVEKVDQYSFTVNYNTIYPGYLTQFGGEQIAIWPAHYCDAEQGFVAWDCGRQPLSDGPFTLTEWVEGDHMTFAKNPKYFEAGKPEIDEVIVRIVPDDTVRKTMMLNGDADIDMWINVNTINDLKDSEVARVSLSPTDRWVMRLFMNEAAKGDDRPGCVAASHPFGCARASGDPHGSGCGYDQQPDLLRPGASRLDGVLPPALCL